MVAVANSNSELVAKRLVAVAFTTSIDVAVTVAVSNPVIVRLLPVAFTKLRLVAVMLSAVVVARVVVPVTFKVLVAFKLPNTRLVPVALSKNSPEKNPVIEFNNSAKKLVEVALVMLASLE